MIRFNLKLAFRNIFKNKIYSILIMGGFAIGFASFILIGLFCYSEKTVNQSFENHKQIYRLYDAKKSRANIHYDLSHLLEKNFAGIEGVCPLGYFTEPITLKNEQNSTDTQAENLLTTTNSFFPIFSINITEKLSDKPFDRKEAVILSKSTALKLFGNENPLGQSVNINNYFSGTVTAIFNDWPINSTFRADIILNSENEAYRRNSTYSGGLHYNPINIFVQLEKNVTPHQFLSNLNSSIGFYALDIDSVGLQNLSDIYLSDLPLKSRHDKGNPGMLKIFLAVGLLILFLSSINYLNYSFSMQFARLKEIGINKINGAHWKNLVQYLIMEVTLGVMFSLIFALIIVTLALPYSNIVFGKDIHFGLNDLYFVVPPLLGVIITVILINSLAPMYVLSRFNINGFLSGFRRNKNQKQFGRRVMLTFQLTVSVALITVVMVVFKQLYFVKNSDLGFEKEKLVRIDIPYKFPHTETLKQELDKLPYVQSSSISSGCPGMINHKYDAGNADNSFGVNCIKVGKDYLKTMGIELKSGRDFLSGDIDKACLMNEEAVKQFQWDNFQGKEFKLGNENNYEVVGIVKDFKFESFHNAIEPLTLLYTNVTGGNILSVKLGTGNTSEQINQFQQIWKKLSPNEPFIFSFYNDLFQSMYEKEERLAKSVTFFCLIAVVLTCMGILGHIFLICLNRVKEIGIRKVNGARSEEIMTMLNKDFLKWVGIAFLISTPIAWYAMHKWLQNFAYRTELNWWLFGTAGGIAVVIALFTVSFLTWRAASKNPVESLRYE